jgi:hypothetical protein
MHQYVVENIDIAGSFYLTCQPQQNNLQTKPCIPVDLKSLQVKGRTVDNPDN